LAQGVRINFPAIAMSDFAFGSLETADLVVDATYVGGRAGNAGDDPLRRLLGVSNSGGFRYRGTVEKLELVVLTSSLSHADWPDNLDTETGVFTYYGDNRHPGRALHETPRNGNNVLKTLFANANPQTGNRRLVPPIFVFVTKGEWRDVVFLGLAVPGTSDIRSSEDLVAIWKSSGGRRFQNYRARFTILDVGRVSRRWIEDVVSENPHTANAPKAWSAWIGGGQPIALRATRSIEYRSKVEQLPKSPADVSILKCVFEYFGDNPYAFEACAAVLCRMLLPSTLTLDVTRHSRDGGRDAIGTLRLGSGETSIVIDFAMEAKCYNPSKSVGVREMSRLISRLRYRQFGVLVTTSFVDSQAYQEITQDGHPVIVIAGGDIVNLLRSNGHGDLASTKAWLDATVGKLIKPNLGNSV
jgi:hypothetical protein